MAFLAGKLHHEYYWLPLAPVAAVGVARAIELLVGGGRAFAAAWRRRSSYLCLFQTRSTWRTPAEWDGLEAAARAVSARSCRRTPGWRLRGALVPGRPPRMPDGMDGRAARRAAGEWGASSTVESPLDLIDYYRPRGARYFADLGSRDPRLAAKGLARRGPATIQGDCGQPRGVDRRTLRFAGRTGMPTEDQPSRFRTSSKWKRERRKISVLTAYDYPDGPAARLRRRRLHSGR